MKEINFEFTVGSDIDYEDLIADIGFDNKLVALLTQEKGFDNIRILIYPPTEGDHWDFRLNEFEEIIHKAKNRLWELRKIEP
jgi:phage pi2 protein 07